MPSSDAQLAERFSKLTGNVSIVHQKPSNMHKTSLKSPTEDELVDDLLGQLQEEAKLETQFEKSSAQSLADRLARLKAFPSSNVDKSTQSSVASDFPSSEAAVSPVQGTNKESKKTGFVDIGWISSDDENNDEVLEKVIQAAMAYETSDED
jgi:hypothetical protein